MVNICALHAGSTYNIIPNECQVMGTIRTFDEEERTWLLDRLQKAMHQVAELYRCQAEWYIGQSAPSTKSDPDFCQKLQDLLTKDLPEIDLIPLQTGKAMGSEDFSFVTQRIPSAAPARKARPIPATIPKWFLTKTALSMALPPMCRSPFLT